MPINVNYAPPMAEIQGLAYGAGMGEYIQRERAAQQALALQLAQMQMSQRQAADRSQQDWARMQLGAQAGLRNDFLQMQNMERQRQQFDAQAANNAELQADRLASSEKMQGQAFDNSTQEHMRQEAFRLAEAQRQEDLQWQQKSAIELEDQVGTINAEMAKARQYMTPEGQNLWGTLSGKLRAIQAQRGELRPDKYNSAIKSWYDDFERSGLAKHIEKPPTVEEQWKHDTVQVAPGTWAVRNGKGGWDEFSPKAPAPDKTAPKPADLYFADPTNFHREYSAAEKKLEDQALAKALKGEGGAPVPPTEEEIHAEMDRAYESRIRFLQKLNPNNSQPVQPVIPDTPSGITGTPVPGSKRLGQKVQEPVMGWNGRPLPPNQPLDIPSTQAAIGQGKTRLLEIVEIGKRNGGKLPPELMQEAAALRQAVRFMHEMIANSGK